MVESLRWARTVGIEAHKTKRGRVRATHTSIAESERPILIEAPALDGRVVLRHVGKGKSAPLTVGERQVSMRREASQHH